MEFPFPFKPWKIQAEFMTNLYNAIESRQIAIFESPTGTGKSLSIICGALKWLTDFHDKSENDQLKAIQDAFQEQQQENKDPSWVTEYKLKKLKEEASASYQLQKENQIKYRERLNELKRLENYQQKSKRFKTSVHSKEKIKAEPLENSFLVDDYESDKDKNDKLQVLNIIKEIEQDHEQEPEIDIKESMQVIYCSRTHSQLSQFVKEIKKTVYHDSIRLISLGSRKNLCIHPQVVNLSSLPRINDKCMDLQKDKKNTCSYYETLQSKKQSFVDLIHANIRDIEDLAELGKENQTCPYYGSREAIQSAQVLVVPYNLILQKAARESLGIDLKDKVIIFDEAHNLMETISSIYSVMIDQSTLERAKLQVNEYLCKYKSKLSGKNIVYIKQILILLDALLGYLTRSFDSGVSNVNDFMHGLDIDHINIFKIEAYLKASRLAQKLQGFVLEKDKPLTFDSISDANSNTKYNTTFKATFKANIEQETKPKPKQEYISKHISALQQVQGFLMSLTNAELDGRVVLVKDPTPHLKYLLLNPAESFKDIVDNARSVILAGGTMEPHQEFINQLYPHIPSQRLGHFSCGHIVPKSSLLTLNICKGPNGMNFNFNYENRQDKNAIIELGKGISLLCEWIPGGIVCFFASYSYMEYVEKIWRVESLVKAKKIFMEPKQAHLSDQILGQYEQTIHQIHREKSHGGALLLAVVGGKMSEGINFSDDLARGVILVGLPFPNLKSIELQEKMKHAERHNGKEGGTLYYENLCMRAVNQSIGRAIRHFKDYAVIILLDQRFQKNRIASKLPGWILNAGVESVYDFALTKQKIIDFFSKK